MPKYRHFKHQKSGVLNAKKWCVKPQFRRLNAKIYYEIDPRFKRLIFKTDFTFANPLRPASQILKMKHLSVVFTLLFWIKCSQGQPILR